jgi:hypothetical protein
MPTITWSKPSIPDAPSFARLGDYHIVGYVTRTAHERETWLAQVLPKGNDYRGLYCYARSEARAKYFVERWLAHHMPDTSGWRRPGKMPHEGDPKLTPGKS